MKKIILVVGTCCVLGVMGTAVAGPRLVLYVDSAYYAAKGKPTYFIPQLNMTQSPCTSPSVGGCSLIELPYLYPTIHAAQKPGEPNYQGQATMSAQMVGDFVSAINAYIAGTAQFTVLSTVQLGNGKAIKCQILTPGGRLSGNSATFTYAVRNGQNCTLTVTTP